MQTNTYRLHCILSGWQGFPLDVPQKPQAIPPLHQNNQSVDSWHSTWQNECMGWEYKYNHSVQISSVEICLVKLVDWNACSIGFFHSEFPYWASWPLGHVIIWKVILEFIEMLFCCLYIYFNRFLSFKNSFF